MKVIFPVEAELKQAEMVWGKLIPTLASALGHWTERMGLSVILGDIILLDGRWYVTHSGLLRVAARRRCAGIRTSASTKLSDPALSRWTFRATVYKNRNCKGFVGYGDAEPSNVSAFVHGAEMRVAETRAVNRALRKAYGIGICSVEEIGSFAATNSPVPSSKKIPPQPVNGHQPINASRVRDRLCQLIRQHQLDPNLVKAYAIDYCGTKVLRDATREQLENFVAQLADWAKKDRDALVCQLNTYMENKAGAA